MVKAKDNDIFSETSGFKLGDIMNILDILGDELTWTLEDLAAVVHSNPLHDEDIYKILNDKYGATPYRLKKIHFNEDHFENAAENTHFYVQVEVVCDTDTFMHKYIVKSTGHFDTLIPLLKVKTLQCKLSLKEIWFHEIFINQYRLKEIPLDECVEGRFVFGRMNDLIVFEDTGKDYRKGSTLGNLDMEMLKAVLVCITKIHAVSLIIEEQKSTRDNLFRWGTNYAQYFDNKDLYSAAFLIMFKKNVLLKMILLKETVDTLTIHEQEEHLNKFIDKSFEFLIPGKTHRNVICHARLWPDNILMYFQRNRLADLRIINYEAYRYIRPEIDIVSLMYTCTNRHFRMHNQNANYHKICDYYCHTMKKILREAHLDIDKFINISEFYLRCDEISLLGIMGCLIMLYMHFEVPKYTSVYLEEKKKRLTNASDMDSTFYENLFQMYPAYKIKLSESISELKEIFKTYLNANNIVSVSVQ